MVFNNMDILNIVKRLIDPFGVEKKKPAPVPRVKRQKVQGKVVAKELTGRDLKDYVYQSESLRHDYCPICHNTLTPIPPQNYMFRKRSGDVWVSYDGFYIVSEKFKQFCETQEYPNLIFTKIEKSSGFYFFTTNEIYKVDYERSNVVFMRKRECCGNYDYIIHIPKYRSKDEALHTDDFIARAEFYFGDGYKKGAVIYVGLKTVQMMQKYGLKGMWFGSVYE